MRCAVSYHRTEGLASKIYVPVLRASMRVANKCAVADIDVYMSRTLAINSFTYASPRPAGGRPNTTESHSPSNADARSHGRSCGCASTEGCLLQTKLVIVARYTLANLIDSACVVLASALALPSDKTGPDHVPSAPAQQWSVDATGRPVRRNRAATRRGRQPTPCR